MSIRHTFIGLLAVITALSAAAAPTTTNALGACLADNTTGKERKELAKWMFVAMASHPELQGLSNITDSDREKTYQALGATVTKLLTQSCPEQTRSALATDAGEAFKLAFGFLGKLAMQELMTNPEVGASFSGFERYIDQQKLKALMP